MVVDDSPELGEEIRLSLTAAEGVTTESAERDKLDKVVGTVDASGGDVRVRPES